MKLAAIRQVTLAASLARRELRGSLWRFRVVIASLALGVGIIAGVGSLSAAIGAGFAADAQAILGGDAEFRLAYREANGKELAALQEGGRVSHAIEIRAMVSVPHSPVVPVLAEVKAVDRSYPLYGALALSPGIDLAEGLAADGQGTFGAIAEPALVDRLGLKTGDMLSVGAARVRLTAILDFEPDRGLRGFSLGPRLLLSPDAVKATGLMQPGALVYHLYRVAYAPGLDGDAYLDQLRGGLPRAGWRIRETTDATEGARRFIDRTGQFLNLIGFAALLIGGIGIANAVRAYLESRARSLAILRCLGATSGLLLLTYAMQVAVMAFIGIGAGLLIGVVTPWLAQFALGGFGLRILPGVGAQPLLVAAGVGILIAACFSLLPLLRARRIRPAQLFRAMTLELGAVRRIDFLLLLFLSTLLAASLMVGTSDRLLGLYFILAAMVALFLFLLLASGIRHGARRLGSRGRASGWPQPIRFALGAIVRPQAPAAGIVVSLGLGLTVLVAIGLIQRGLARDIEETLPAAAPSFYFIDIQPAQLAGFLGDLAAYPGAHDIEHVPMLRGRIVAVNGIPSEKIQASDDVSWVLKGDRGITWSAARPEKAQLVAGEWWPADYAGDPLISLDADTARGLGIGIGDRLTVNILGREVTGRIANLREINWATLDINFIMVFSPGLIASAPQTHIATVRVDAAAETGLVTTFAVQYPNIPAVRVKDAIATAARVLDAVGWAVRAAAGITLLVGALVLSGAMATGQERRIYEAVLLKMLGGRRRDVALGYATEFAILAGLSATFALLAGSAAAYLFLTGVMESSWVFDLPLILGIIVASLGLALGIGFAGSWRALGVRAAPYLRNE